MTKTIKKQPSKAQNPTEQSIEKALSYLIEECIREGFFDRAEKLKKALDSFGSTMTISSENMGVFQDLLKRVISLEQDELNSLIDIIDILEEFDVEAVHYFLGIDKKAVH